MNVVRDLRERCGLTQDRLAERANTSQPTLAAYASGRKSPNLRTRERLARAVGLEAVVDFVPPTTREERRSLAVHRAIAAKLQENPERLLERAGRMLELMSEKHPGAGALLSEWKRTLALPVSEIVEVLLDNRPRARELRHVTPFGGVLTAPERALVYRQFRSSDGAVP